MKNEGPKTQYQRKSIIDQYKSSGQSLHRSCSYFAMSHRGVLNRIICQSQTAVLMYCVYYLSGWVSFVLLVRNCSSELWLDTSDSELISLLANIAFSRATSNMNKRLKFTVFWSVLKQVSISCSNHSLRDPFIMCFQWKWWSIPEDWWVLISTVTWGGGGGGFRQQWQHQQQDDVDQRESIIPQHTSCEHINQYINTSINQSIHRSIREILRGVQTWK